MSLTPMFFEDEFVERYSLEYYEYMKSEECCITGTEFADPHHLIAIGMGQSRKKPSSKHFTIVPLCREMHTELHQIGIHKFQEKYNIQLWQKAFNMLFNWFIVQTGRGL